MESVCQDSFNQGQDLSQDLYETTLQNDALLSEFNSLRISYDELRSRSMETEANLISLKHHIDEVIKTAEEISCEREVLGENLREVKFAIKEREEEQRDNDIRKTRIFSQGLDSVKESLLRVVERIDEKLLEKHVEIAGFNANDMGLNGEAKAFMMEIMFLHKVVMKLESRLKECVVMKKKEKRELENSLVSLTEENRDVNGLLRIALVEKEAVEKEISKLKGGGEQKRVSLLQFAERGLHKVGFGFMMGTTSSPCDSDSNMCGRSDTSGGEEEVVTLASTVEKLMKNLRFEIAQLKQFLEESRLDNERLQNLNEKQAQKIAECTSYINDLEAEQSRLVQNIEQLLTELRGAQEEVERWREACELEVKAGKHVIEEQQNQAVVIEKELDKAKGCVDRLSSKLKLKEELAAAAMAAQEAARKSVEVADRRAAELQERIEELTRQLELEESRGEWKIRRKVRHICWPWSSLAVNPGGPTRRMVPEMQSLLYRI